MAYDADITSANATLVLTVDELYPAGIQLQQFSTDQAASMDNVQVAETRMGVDGRMAAGFTPAIHPVTITLEACSPSYDSMVLLWQTMYKQRKPFECTLVARVPSIGVTYTWSVGVLYSGTPLPSLRRVLDPTSWTFHFEKFEAASDI